VFQDAFSKSQQQMPIFTDLIQLVCPHLESNSSLRRFLITRIYNKILLQVLCNTWPELRLFLKYSTFSCCRSVELHTRL